METAITRSELTPLQSISPILRGVLIEAIRRKEFYSVFIIAGLFALAALIVQLVGIENASTGTFIYNLGLTYAYYAAHLIAGLLIIKQVPSEIENRTLYPILAKPVTRLSYLMGKWVAAFLIGSIVFLILTAFVWVTSPKMEDYNTLLLAQNVVLNICSIGALCSLCLFLSLVFPVPVAMITAGLIFIFSDNLNNMITARFSNEGIASVIEWVLSYLPNFNQFSLITRYTDGIAPLSLTSFGGLFLYGVVLISFFIIVSGYLFSRRPL